MTWIRAFGSASLDRKDRGGKDQPTSAHSKTVMVVGVLSGCVFVELWLVGCLVRTRVRHSDVD